MQIEWSTVSPDATRVVLENDEGEIVEEYKRPKPVVLTLTPAQAQALRTVTARVGGDPDTTERRYIDDVCRMLEAAGYYSLWPHSPATGNIRFER